MSTSNFYYFERIKYVNSPSPYQLKIPPRINLLTMFAKTSLAIFLLSTIVAGSTHLTGIIALSCFHLLIFCMCIDVYLSESRKRILIIAFLSFFLVLSLWNENVERCTLDNVSSFISKGVILSNGETNYCVMTQVWMGAKILISLLIYCLAFLFL